MMSVRGLLAAWAVVVSFVPAAALDLDAPAPPPGPAEFRVPERAGDGTIDGAGDGAPPAETRGNPLWAIPLDALAATRERPIFSSSRRPPPPAAQAPSPEPEAPAAPLAAAGPGQPRLALVGTMVGGAGGYAFFLDPATSAPVRLRTGEKHEGWVLRSVSARDVLLQNGTASAVLAMPSSGGAGLAGAGPAGVASARAGAHPAAGRTATPARSLAAAPASERIVAPRRPAPSPADLDSSH